MASDVMNLLTTEVQYAKWDMGTCHVGRLGVREGSKACIFYLKLFLFYVLIS